MRCLLTAVFVVSALFAVTNVYAGEMSVTKCTVTAGKTEGYDTILVSGKMNATADDLSDADNIQVTVDSSDMVNPCVQSFPINVTTFKKGKYKCSKTENSSKTSFTFDTKTSKFSFTAKNVDLSGLGCPLAIEIEIGGYNAGTEVTEAVVNGAKKPIPIKLMMGVKNALRVDSCKVKHGKKPNTDQLTAKGGFAVEDMNVNLVNEEFVVTLDTQTFTLPAGSFKAGKNKFTCSKANVTEGGIASATFNFTTCSFTITIKKTEIEADPGAADFGLEFGNFNVTQSPHSPSPKDLLGDAAWSLPPSGRRLTTISWINHSGITVKSFAYSGEVEIIVDPTKMTHADVQTLVSRHQAAIFARLPAIGLYWVNVSAGSEASFIAALRGTVTDVFPVFATATKQTNSHLQLPLNYDNSIAAALPYSVSSGNLVLDDFTEPMCIDNCPSLSNPNPTGPQVYLRKDFDGSVALDEYGNFVETTTKYLAAAHGDIVNFYRTNRYQLLDYTLGQSTVDVRNPSLPSPLLPGTVDDMLNIASMIEGATDIGQKAVINYSIGPAEYGSELERITGWESYNQNNYNEKYEELSALLGADVPGAHDTIIVQAAGNSGTDLTSVLVEQQTWHPTAAKQIVQVGALDYEGNIASYSNYSAAAGTMIYVPVADITDQGSSVDGTSFAAPQIQYLVNQIMKNRPDLTPDQLRQVLFDESVAPKQQVQRPNAPFGEKIWVSVINNPFDPTVLKAAIAAANHLFPQTTTCTYSISPTSASFGSSGGSGSVTVTAPDNCAWTAASNDGWITIDSGSSGNGNDTVNYSVAENISDSPRTGTMTIAGQTFTATQDGSGSGVTVSVSPTEATLGAIGGCPGGSAAATFNVTAPSNVTWTIERSNGTEYSSASGGGSGSGSFQITITVPPDSPTPGFTCSNTAQFNYYEDYTVRFIYPDGTGSWWDVGVYWTFVLVL